MTIILDGTNGLTFNNATTQNSGGKVLQVVHANYSTAVSTSTNTLIDTGLTASITPLFSTSKILVLISQNGVAKSTGNVYIQIALLRNSSPIINFAISSAYTGTSGVTNEVSNSTCYLDSPATTSATVYKTQFCSNGNTATATVQNNNAMSTITLMEIAG